MSIGQYPDVSLAQARKAKEVVRSQVAEGIAPSEAKQEAKALAREAHGNTFAKIDAAFVSKQQIEDKLGLSRSSAAPSACLSHTSLKGDRAFRAQC
ncbi:Arm DNA-binding domain-containing protein [Pacificibacter marinus]|nr:Arm DNA-binding domain-containing protein [Pacificibacter marinus]